MSWEAKLREVGPAVWLVCTCMRGVFFPRPAQGAQFCGGPEAEGTRGCVLTGSPKSGFRGMRVYQGILWAHLKEAQLTADKVQKAISGEVRLQSRPGPEVCFIAAHAR